MKLYFFVIHTFLHSWPSVSAGSTTLDSTNSKSKIFGKKFPESSKKQSLNGNHLHSIYVLGFISNLHVPQLLSLYSRAREPQLLSPCATTTEAHVPRAHAPQQEKLQQWEAHAPQRRVAPALHDQRKAAQSNEDPTQPKINKINKFIKKK